MNKSLLLSKLESIKLSSHQQELHETAWEVIDALLEYIDNGEIEDAVDDIPF